MTAIRTILEITPRSGRTAEAICLHRSPRAIETATERGLCPSDELLVPDGGTGALIGASIWPDSCAYDEWVRTRPYGLKELYDALELTSKDLPSGKAYDIEIAATADRPTCAEDRS